MIDKVVKLYIISERRICHGENPANVSWSPIEMINSGSGILLSSIFNDLSLGLFRSVY